MAVRIATNARGVEFYLKGGGGVAEAATDTATTIADAADANTGRAGDHRVEVQVGRKRFRAAVITDTFNAMHREADSRSLTRAIDAGRR